MSHTTQHNPNDNQMPSGSVVRWRGGEGSYKVGNEKLELGIGINSVFQLEIGSIITGKQQEIGPDSTQDLPGRSQNECTMFPLCKTK